jgi:hypothetical protein
MPIFSIAETTAGYSRANGDPANRPPRVVALDSRLRAGLSGKMFGGDERMPDESGETGYLLVVETQEESRACATRIAFSAS